jgi:cytochrome c oxidase subunit II
MGKGSQWWSVGGHGRPGGRNRSTNLSLIPLIALLSAIALAGTASAHAAGSAYPEDWDRLLLTVTIMAIIVAVLVYSIIALALWRYRESNPRARNEPSTHNFKLEAIWTTIPIVLVTVIIILSLQVLSTTDDIPPEGVHIDVVARQFEWLFIYPDNTTTLNELWVEEGQTVIFRIWSTDVIHSFWLPDFRLKVDAFPNYVDDAFILAETPGDYPIVCAEFCGDIHSGMVGTLHIFEKGLSDKPYGPPPGEVPPPPEVEQITVDIELRQDGGPSAATLWSMKPSLIDLPIDSDVTFRIWNNGTDLHGFHLAAPYDLTISEIPPGELAYLNFTADMPTRGILASCPDEDHRVKGMKATVVVTREPHEGGTDGDSSPAFSAGILYGMGLLLLGVVLVAAVREPKGVKHEDHHVPVDEEHEEFHVDPGEEEEEAKDETKDGQEGDGP